MFQISNAEFILLSLIHEQEKVTGYHLNRLIEEQGYRDWTDIGTTSIYTGLKKLKQKQYVTSATDRYKKGRGPKGVIYSLTPEGLELLKAEVEQGLSSARGRSGQFMLAISALPVLPMEKVIRALEQRKTSLEQRLEHVQQTYERQQAYMPFHADLLFQYSFAAIRREVTFTEEMIVSIKQQEHEVVT
jgi:DNA-binding PadR family transcriptional regulator